MSLNFAPKNEVIDLQRGDFISLRGLGPGDIMSLVETHRTKATLLFAKFAGRKPDELIEVAELDCTFLLDLASFSSCVINDIIARAADDPDQIELIGKLPLGAQLLCLETIGRLSFAQSGGAISCLHALTRAAFRASDISAAARSSK